MKYKLLSLFLLSLPLVSSASTLPISRGYDARVKKVDYNPKDVFKVFVKIGVSSLIQLEENETVIGDTSGIGLGDADAWGFAVRGNNIFLKPVAEQPDTNMIITTDKGRTYAFDLVTTRYNPTYILKMDYPITYKQKMMEQPRAACSLHRKNFDYQKWGDLNLSPSAVWDDGVFTCIKFPPMSELPVVYKKLADGTESLTNSHMENDILVIHSINGQYRLRAADMVLGLKTDKLVRYSNVINTSIKNTKRVVKHGR